jgi:chaperonin GroES
MQLVPLADRIVIHQTDRTATTETGIHLPDVGAGSHSQGEVVAVGPTVSPQQDPLTVGDQIVFQKYAGVEVRVDATTYVVIREKDVLAVLRDDK